jgi:hypothetical protein
LVVPWNVLTIETKEKLLHELRSRLQSAGMNLIVQEVERIPSGPRGYKKPFLVSNVPLEDRFRRGRD